MFNKDNIISVRYTNPENTNIEVIYTEEDGRNIPFYLAASPTTVPAWKILKEAGWTPSKIADSTVDWIRDQTTLQYQVAERFAEQLSNKHVNELRDQYNKDVLNIRNEYNDQVSNIRNEYNDQVQDIRNKYDARVTDISSSINSDTTVKSLYTLINDLNEHEEAVFKFKLDLLEDDTNFKGMNKTDEKTKRREIRKCKTLKDLLSIL